MGTTHTLTIIGSINNERKTAYHGEYHMSNRSGNKKRES